MSRSEKNKQIAKEFYFGVQNSRKARIGGLEGLLDPEIMNRKKAQEKKLRQKWNDVPRLRCSAAVSSVSSAFSCRVVCGVVAIRWPEGARRGALESNHLTRVAEPTSRRSG